MSLSAGSSITALCRKSSNANFAAFQLDTFTPLYYAQIPHFDLINCLLHHSYRGKERKYFLTSSLFPLIFPGLVDTNMIFFNVHLHRHKTITVEDSSSI
jgi:hypothetical protein